MARKRTKPRMRQLRLGTADDNSLVILGRERYKSLQTPYEVDPDLFKQLPFSDYTGDDLYIVLNPPFPILNLPEELIEEIIKLAYNAKYGAGISQRGPYRPGARFRVACRLYPVCQLFRRLVIPMMYSYISLRNWPDHEATSDAQNRLRCRTLQENPSFARHCRTLDVQAYVSKSPVPYEIKAFMSKFKNVRNLTVSGYFHPGESLSDYMLDLLKRMLPLMKQVENFELKMDMPEYEEGSWSEETRQPLELLCGALNALHNLKTLRLYGLNSRDALPMYLQGSIAITSLTINNYSGLIAGLIEFLKWPAALEHFKFVNEPPRSKMRLQDFGNALSGQRYSLKNLELDVFTSRPENTHLPIDVSAFLTLECIQLSSKTMTPIWSPELLCSTILSAPRLKKLVWNFTQFDYYHGDYCTSLSDFGSEQASWLIAAVRLAHARGCKLREVEIQFYPQDVDYSLVKDGWEPLRLMGEIEKEMEGMGMRLEYTRYRTKEKDEGGDDDENGDIKNQH